MSKKKKQEKRVLFRLEDKTKHWIFAIGSLALMFFFILAIFAKAGPTGSFLYDLLSRLFGAGYFLFPLVFLILAIVFFRFRKPDFLASTLIGVIILFFSGLGLIDVLYGKGGLVGNLISSGISLLVGVYVAVILLSALVFISLLLTFDATPSFAILKRLIPSLKKLEGDTPVTVSDYSKEDGIETANEEDEVQKDNEEAEEEKEKSTKIFTFKGSGDKKDGKSTAKSPPLLFNKEYLPPPLSLLQPDKGKSGVGDIKASANVIKRTLQEFGISVEMNEISVGPSVTRFALKPAQGVKLSRIVGLQSDLALALAAHPLRIEAPIPGHSLVGIEIPNSSRVTVGLGTLFAEGAYEESIEPLLVSLGRSVTGKPYFGGLNKMPHLLIAGATGSGKSVAIHSIISSLLYRNAPENLQFILIDPKRVELTLYNSIPHLRTPVITDPKKAILALKWAAKEMDRRYDILETESVRDIKSYHKNIVEPAYEAINKKKKSTESDLQEESPDLPERMPYIVIIIDELADIMSTYPRELESSIVRLAQMSRATGIHLILSTQRPSVNVITGLIKANVPARMAFQVASQTDSRTILDMGGAEKLLGAGDMLYVSGEMSKPVRLQSAFVSEDEIKKVVRYLKKEYDNPTPTLNLTSQGEEKDPLFEALENGEKDEDEDDLYEDARETVIKAEKASTTFLQRKLRIGYARAARLMDILEERGVVGPQEGSKQRDVLVREHEEGYGIEEKDDV